MSDIAGFIVVSISIYLLFYILLCVFVAMCALTRERRKLMLLLSFVIVFISRVLNVNNLEGVLRSTVAIKKMIVWPNRFIIRTNKIFSRS